MIREHQYRSHIYGGLCTYLWYQIPCGRPREDHEQVDYVTREIEEAMQKYTAVFDERNRYYVSNPESNTHQLLTKQGFANQKLKTQGHLFLNEVYDLLGFPRTRDGQSVGWMWRGDKSFVNFGIENLVMRDQIGPITLTFNVDGNILDEFMSESAARP